MPDPFKLLGVDPERAKQGAAYAGTQALDLLYSPLYMKALGDALSSFMGSTPPRPQQEAPTPEAAPYQALTGALMEPLRRLGEEQSGRVAELEALYPQFVQEALTGMRGLGEQYEEANPELAPILAIMQLFHGSPHRFNKFRHADEIARTGQGANSFGHGIYLAENPAVANQYFKDLSHSISGEISNAKNEIQRAQRENTKFADMLYGKLERPKNKAGNPVDDTWLKEQMADNARYIEEANSWISKRQGQVYEVAGDFDPEDLLDWDVPYEQQPENVQKALAPLVERLVATGEPVGQWTGRDFVNKLEFRLREMTERLASKRESPTLSDRFWMREGKRIPASDPIDQLLEKYEFMSPQQRVSKVLDELGIPGLRYLDQGSRTAKDGTRNIVWWGDPEKLQIKNPPE